jgi:hypothetical protein
MTRILIALVIGASLLAQTVAPPKLVKLAASVDLTLTLGPGLISVCADDGSGSSRCTIAVDGAYVMIRVAAPPAWPPDPKWCIASAQRAEDGQFEYGCSTRSDGTLKAYRIMVQMAP